MNSFFALSSEVAIIGIQGIARSVQCYSFNAVPVVICTLNAWCSYSFSSLKHYTAQVLVLWPRETRIFTGLSETATVTTFFLLSGAELFL